MMRYVEPMPAISLWQPYASLIAVNAKPIETRHWPAPARFLNKRIAIHAAARKPTRDEIDELQDPVSDALGFCHWHKRIPYGAVVCTAFLAWSYIVRDRFYDGNDGVDVVLGDAVGSSIRDDGFGDYSIGRWCWGLCDVILIDPPIPAKGHQGWWAWDGVAA